MKLWLLLKKNDGNSIILYGILLSFLLGISALVVDIGRVSIEKSRFQNALDAAVLAAVAELPNKAQAEAVAKQYIEKNGFRPEDILVTFQNNDKEVHIQGSKEIQYLVARVLQFDAVTIRPKAAASGGPGRAFDYALFSGSTIQTLIISGGGVDITGSTHTNENFSIRGGRTVITGACEAAGVLVLTGNNYTLGSQVPGAPILDMPDLSDIIREQAQSVGNYYDSNWAFNNNTAVNSSIYVNGTVTVNSGRFSGAGCILAKDDIVFNGSSLYSSPSDAVCFYSENGDITINGQGAEIHGIIYAPNGTVTFNGAYQTVYGRVIAKNINFHGTGLTVVSRSNDLQSLPVQTAKLIH